MLNFFKLFFIVFFINTHLCADVNVHDFKKYKKSQNKFVLSEEIKGLDYPWGITFIDKKNVIITEKNGGLVKINLNSKKNYQN